MWRRMPPNRPRRDTQPAEGEKLRQSIAWDNGGGLADRAELNPASAPPCRALARVEPDFPMRPGGFEPPANGLEVRRSVH